MSILKTHLVGNSNELWFTARADIWDEKNYAAIAPTASSLEYGLTIIAQDIQEIDENFTRFWLLGHTTPKIPLPVETEKMTLALTLSDNLPGALYKALQQELTDILAPKVGPLVIDNSHSLFVILMVGVNGVGKTTTIGKLAKRLQAEGKSVMLAAGDTFRAAATEQLQVWGERNNIPVVAQGHGSDSASVIFDAMQSAKARGIDVLIADTAGRLQNKTNLMEELKKVIRVMQKADPTAPHETMIVLDAGTGQNALNQVEIFNEAVTLTGVTVTKLDGTAKGGVVFNIAENTAVPIRFIGVGEKIDDLRPFKADEFVKALFEKEE